MASAKFESKESYELAYKRMFFYFLFNFRPHEHYWIKNAEEREINSSLNRRERNQKADYL